MKNVAKIPINSVPVRALIVVAVLVLISGSFVSAKWGFANTVATRTDMKEISELGVDLAPSDPLVRFANAVILEKTFDFADITRSLGEYETAVALSPHDYRLWLGLGRARERDGDREGAERAFRKGLEFAPHYSRVQWALGNLLVRQGKFEEGFAQIRAAADSDPTFAAPAASAAWQALDGDVDKVRSVLGESDTRKTELAKLLVGQKKFDDAMSIWTSIAEEKRRNDLSEASKFLISKFLEGSKYRYAAEVSGVKPGVIENGGFEDGVRLQNAGPFDWQIGNAVYPQIAMTDGQKKEGKVSLVILFSNPSDLEWRPVSKLIAVEPGRGYKISFAFRSELKTQGEVRWEVTVANGSQRLAVSDPIAQSGEWKTAAFNFTAPSDVDGVTLRLIRENCAAGSCTMSGNLWFDEFGLSPSE